MLATINGTVSNGQSTGNVPSMTYYFCIAIANENITAPPGYDNLIGNPLKLGVAVNQPQSATEPGHEETFTYTAIGTVPAGYTVLPVWYPYQNPNIGGGGTAGLNQLTWRTVDFTVEVISCSSATYDGTFQVTGTGPA